MRNMGIKAMLEHRSNKKRASETKGSNQGRPPAYRVYCPICPQKGGDPELWSHISVPAHAKLARCAAGHEFSVGTAARPGGRHEGAPDDSA